MANDQLLMAQRGNRCAGKTGIDWFVLPLVFLVAFSGCEDADLYVAALAGKRHDESWSTQLRPSGDIRDHRRIKVYVDKSALSDEGTILVEVDGIVIDLHTPLVGSPNRIPPDQFTGRAIVIRNAKNVSIKNATISGFKIAIYAENCPNLTIENCDVSNNYRQRLKSTPEKEDESDWLYGHENDNDEWLRYGGGIFLKNCPNATIKNCRARNGQNGICLVRCDDATVTDCDMSFMSGWGLAMWRSSKCKIIGNRFDYCVRGYSHGVYARGQDSTGILVYEQCSDNVFAFNHATHGGDGFFLYAGNETVNKTGEGGCNRNLVYMNDFSYAVANGIEATFSDENVFLKNKLNHCEHGIWAGYSSRSHIWENEIVSCRNGISIEHGRGNQIKGNTFEACHRGVWLWWDDDQQLLNSPYAKRQGAESRDETVSINRFQRCEKDIDAIKCQNLTASGNRLTNPKSAESVAADIPEMRSFFDSKAFPWGPAGNVRIPALSSGEPTRLGTKPLGPLPNIPEGKQHILIDEWGPYDFSSPKLTPLHVTSWGTSKLRVLGSGQPFKIESLSAGISAAPMSGIAPAEITLRGADPNSSMIPYDVTVSLAGKPVRATGTLWQADWAVVYHTWDGSTDPRKGEEFWRRGRNFKPPILKENRDRIDFHWGGGGPTPDAKDHFALVTTTTLTLPAGQWRLRTISDDGVRVYVDKKKVIDNWTWHIPTEDKADVTATEGPHEVRIEYFEIDGNAQLQFLIEPAPSATSQPAS